MTTEHPDPCCHKHGCPCRLDARGRCKVCDAKIKADNWKIQGTVEEQLAHAQAVIENLLMEKHDILTNFEERFRQMEPLAVSDFERMKAMFTKGTTSTMLRNGQQRRCRPGLRY